LQNDSLWFGQVSLETERLFYVDLPIGRVRYAFYAHLENAQEVRNMISEMQNDDAPVQLRWIPSTGSVEIDDGTLVEGNVVIVDYLDWKPVEQ
jgi:hypothetical protein